MEIEQPAEKYLEEIPMWASKKNSLQDIRRFLDEMGAPDEEMKILHVAGTNGKGSVCAFLESALIEAGWSVGTFISPHLVEIRERFRINGEMVPQKDFEESVWMVKGLSEGMQREGFCHPSYFEFLFYMAMDLFRKAKTDYVILETGLGGRLDTTNVIRKPLACAITSISLDHTEYLGDTIEKIAFEKAGIMKHGVPVVFDGNDPQAAAVLRQRAKALDIPMYEALRQEVSILSHGERGLKVRLLDKQGRPLEALLHTFAEYQAMNALIALRTLEAAGLYGLRDSKLTGDKLLKGFESMVWPARMEEALPGVFLDGAHNPGGIKAFLETAADLCRERRKRAVLLFSTVADKEYGSMIREIAEGLPLDGVAVAHIDSHRGLKSEVLVREFKALLTCRVEGYFSVQEAFEAVLKQKEESQLLFCAGSLYLMGEIKAVLRRNRYD